MINKENEMHARFKRLESDRAIDEYNRKWRKELEQVITRAKRSHNMALESQLKKIPKLLNTYIKNKRITRENVGLLNDKGGNLCLESGDGDYTKLILCCFHQGARYGGQINDYT